MLSSNHLSPKEPRPNTLYIWIFHDDRYGHLNQLKGLANRLAFHASCEIYWFDVNKQNFSIRNFFSKGNFLKKQIKPDLIIGAGRKTNLSVLMAGLKFNAFTALIMKPSLPIWLFNAIICPKHDDLTDSKRVLNTFGPINNIDKQKMNEQAKNRSINLILLGGESKHYHFDSPFIIEQIKEICLEQPNIQWILSNSPRSPKEIAPLLKQLDLPNLSVHDYKQGDLRNIQDIFLETKFTWVTPDSMSMIFEALTAGSQVGLIYCKPKNMKRVVTQVKNLIDESYVTPFKHRSKENLPQKELPWEADRAALWLLNQLPSKKSKLRS